MATDKPEKASKWRHVLRRRQTSTESPTGRSPPAASNVHHHHHHHHHPQTTHVPIMTRHPQPAQPMVGQQYYGIFGQGTRRRQRPSSGEPVSPPAVIVQETFLLPHPPTPKKDGTLEQLIKQLSLKDDPRQFGPGTLAARRMQREELDSMMARDLFRREVAVNLQNRPHPQVARQASGSSSAPSSPDSAPGSPRVLDDKTMKYLRPAFTEDEWTAFSKDPLHYLHKHGLPKQKEQPPPIESVIEEADEDETTTTEASGLSPVTETKPSKGLTPEDIACVVTQFPFYDAKDEGKGKPSRSRVKGTRMPKGASTTAILSKDEASECAICLGDFELGEKIGLLPCCHRFHAECVTDWLQRDASCPECREDFKDNLR